MVYRQWGPGPGDQPQRELYRPIRELMANRFMVGTPDQCARTLRAINETLGPTEVVVHSHWPGRSIGDTHGMPTIAYIVFPQLTWRSCKSKRAGRKGQDDGFRPR